MEDSRKTAQAMIEWILSQTDDRYTITETSSEGSDTILLKTEFASACVNIYYLEYTIMELRINSDSGENVFYLHFELSDPEHAKELFMEMKECLLRQKNDSVLHVLLCCTAGLTTSFFTMKLNESAAAMGLKMDFEAVPYEHLYESGAEKDVVLLAPQIGYRYKDACSILTGKTVLQIPPALFATYDALGVINFIRESHAAQESEAVQQAGVEVLSGAAGTVLLVSVIDMERRTQLAYRIYNNCEVTAENQIVKDTYSSQDLIDLIDPVVRLNNEIDTICIVSPGSFKDGRLTYEKANIIDFDIHENIEERYHIKAVMLNSTDAIALGYSQEELNGEAVGFYFLPTGSSDGSISISSYGKVYGAAGKMGGSHLRCIGDLMTFPRNPYVLARTPEGNVQLAARYLTGLIAYSGLDHIAYYAKMIPDTDALKAAMEEFIRPEYIPEIRKVTSIREYLCAGTLYFIGHGKE